MDFALACGKRVIAFSQLGKVALPLACHTVAIQSLADRIQQVLVVEGLVRNSTAPDFMALTSSEYLHDQ